MQKSPKPNKYPKKRHQKGEQIRTSAKNAEILICTLFKQHNKTLQKKEQIRTSAKNAEILICTLFKQHNKTLQKIRDVTQQPGHAGRVSSMQLAVLHSNQRRRLFQLKISWNSFRER